MNTQILLLVVLLICEVIGRIILGHGLSTDTVVVISACTILGEIAELRKASK